MNKFSHDTPGLDQGNTLGGPRVSIVTVSFNQAQYLEAAIRSVLDQDYPNIEYILMDGGSTDGSEEIIKLYAASFSYCRIGPDGGAAQALNEGFKHASGEIFAFLNSDDVLNPTTVSKWVASFKANPVADLVYGDIELIDARDRPTHLPGKRVSIFRAASWHLRAHAAEVLIIPQQACAWRRRVHELTGGFNRLNKTCWDGEFFADAAMAGCRFILLKGILAKFRVHSASISFSIRLNEAYEADKQRIKRSWQAAGHKISWLERILWKIQVQGERFFRQPSALWPQRK